MLSKLCSFLPKHVLKMIYYSLIHSRISYLTLIWGCARRVHRRPLEVLQNRAIKRCQRVPNRTNTVQLYHDANVLPIRGICDMQMWQLAFDWIKMPTICPSSIELSYPSTDRLRRINNLVIPRVRNHHGETSVNHRLAKLYNSSLDCACIIESNNNRITFKQKIKTVLMSKESLALTVY